MLIVIPGIQFKFRSTKLRHNDMISQFNIRPAIDSFLLTTTP
jgi:hypothetical protein